MLLIFILILNILKIRNKKYHLSKGDYFKMVDDKMHYFPSTTKNIIKISNKKAILDSIPITQKYKNSIVKLYGKIDNINFIDGKYTITFTDEIETEKKEVLHESNYTEDLYFLYLNENKLEIKSSKIIKETNKTIYLLNKLNGKTRIKKSEIGISKSIDKFSIEQICYTDFKNFDESRDEMFSKFSNILELKKEKLPITFQQFQQLKKENGYI